tara:strand:- start:399 stop:620 length:222 start_codon:yes stop_codon:yes gene_type:complete
MICTGIGTPAGIIILVIYFYEDIRKHFRFSQYTDNTFNINHLNVHSDGRNHSDKDDFDTPIDYLGKDTREEMR